MIKDYDRDKNDQVKEKEKLDSLNLLFLLKYSKWRHYIYYDKLTTNRILADFQ